MLKNNKTNYYFFGFLLLCLLLGFSFFSVLSVANGADPISGLNTAVEGTGLEQSANVPELVGNIIKTALTIIGVVFLVLIIYAGVMWMLAHGEEAKIKSARAIIITAVTGFIIIMVAYGITSFVISAFQSSGSTSGGPESWNDLAS